MTNPSTPTPAEAEADAEQARAGLVSTLSRLRENLQPAHVVEEVMGNAKVSAEAISNQIWDTARKNPLPALMIGAGLAMIFGLGSRAVSSSSGIRDAADQRFDANERGPASAVRARPASVLSAGSSRLAEPVDALKSHASGLLDGANERLADVASKAASLGRQLPSTLISGDPMSASRHSDTLMTTVSRVLEEQPLILAAIGIAVGAAIGAAIPQTDTENSLMGESSHSVRDAAQGLVQDQYAQLKSAASSAVDDIKQSVADHGVTTDNLSGLVHEVGEKAKAATYEAGRSLDPTKA